MKIVFCCTGNTCRSPMAEYLLKDYLIRNEIIDIKVMSCGISGDNSGGISIDSMQVLSEIGIDASSHLSQSITLRELIDADYIFAMTSSHVYWLENNMNASENVMTLGGYVGMGDVPDPFGGSTNQYRECRDILIEMIDKMANKLFHTRK